LLTDFNVETLVSEICETPIVPLSNALHRLSLITCPNQSLVGTQQVAWLNFTAAPGQTSAFLELQFTDLEGHQPDGGTVANFAPQSGRVVVVGEEPMLELLHSTNNSALLILYGKPLYSYQLESAPSLQTPIQWAPWQQLALTNLFAPVNVAITNQQRFYRAVRFGAILPQRVLGISVANSTNVVLACSGIAGRVYHVQFSPSLATPVWQTVGTATADNDGLFQITDTNGWRQAERYYRTIWP
jgi:hypothetical protein